MKTLLSLFVCLFLASHSSATEDVAMVGSSSGYWNIESTKHSPDNLSKAVLYKFSPKPKYEVPRHRLKIATPDNTWWINSGDWQAIKRYEFIDNNHLLILSGNLRTESQSIVDLKTRDITWIGGGVGELLSWDSESKYGLIRLRGQKHYFPAPEWGAFWVDMIVDTKGDVIEVLPPNSKYLGECVSLNLILDQEKEYPKLKQSMKDCVRVER